MKKFLILLVIVLIALISITISAKTGGHAEVTITTDRDSYSPSMSYIQGIKMTSKFKSKNNYKNLKFYWTTPEGSFILNDNQSSSKVKNKGESVLWSATRNNRVVDIKNSFKIHLEVIDSKKVLAVSDITIRPKDGFYEIRK